MVVGNDVTSDTRVKKCASSAAAMGLDVTVLGITREKQSFETWMGNVRILRLPLANNYRTQVSVSTASSGPTEAEARNAYRSATDALWLAKREYQAAVGRLREEKSVELERLKAQHVRRRSELDEWIQARVAEAKDTFAGHGGPNLLLRVQRQRLNMVLSRARRMYSRRRDQEAARYEKERSELDRRIAQSLEAAKQVYEDAHTRSRRARATYEEIRADNQSRPTQSDTAMPLPQVEWRQAHPLAHDLERALGPTLDEIEPDLIHAHDMHVIGIAVRSAQRARARGRAVSVIYDAHEYVKGLRRHMPPERLAANLDMQSEYIRQVDRVITVSEPLAALLQQDYDLPEAPDVILNAPLVSAGCTQSSVPSIRDRIGLHSDIPLVVYSGRMHPSRGVGTLVEAMQWLPDVHLALVGEPSNSYREELTDAAEELSLNDRLHMLPYVPAEAIIDHLRTATLGVNLLLPVPNHELSLPNKFFEYLHSGLPVLNADVGISARLTLEMGIGEVFTPEDPEDLARALTAMLSRIAAYKSAIHRQNARLRQFSWELQEERLRKVYADLLGTDLPSVSASTRVPLVETATTTSASRTQVAFGSRNRHGKFESWAACLEARGESGIGLHVFSRRGPSGAGSPDWFEVVEEAKWSSLPWCTRLLGSLTVTFSHAIIDSAGLFGAVTGGRWDADVAILAAHGIETAVVIDDDDIARDQDLVRVQRTRGVAGAFFAATPAALLAIPGAIWLPYVTPFITSDPPAASSTKENEPLRVAVGREVAEDSVVGQELTGMARAGVISLNVVDCEPGTDVAYRAFSTSDVLIDVRDIDGYSDLAVDAMATGTVVLGHPSAQLEQHVDSSPPILAADTASVVSGLIRLYENRAELEVLAGQSLEFVRRFHDGRHAAEAMRAFLR